jgi:hypothetical protein
MGRLGSESHLYTVRRSPVSDMGNAFRAQPSWSGTASPLFLTRQAVADNDDLRMMVRELLQREMRLAGAPVAARVYLRDIRTGEVFRLQGDVCVADLDFLEFTDGTCADLAASELLAVHL